MGIHQYKEHCSEILEAHQYLLHTVIPDFAKKLDKTNVDLETIQMELHTAGLNIRYLGKVRILTEKEETKHLLLVECISRVFKSNWRSLLRKVCRSICYPGDEPYRRATKEVNLFSDCTLPHKFLNIIIGKSSKSHIYWNVYLKQSLMQKFSNVLSPEEQNADMDLRVAMNKSITLILNRFLQTTSIR